MKGILLAFLLIALATTAALGAELAIRAARVHPVSSPVIEDGVVLVKDGKITKIGPASKVRVPPGATVLEAQVVTPGLVDVHTVVGFAGIYNSTKGQVQDQDQLEKSDPVQPDLRAVDAYDPIEPLVLWVREFGVTTVHTGHGPGAVISGQTLIAKTRGETVSEAVIRPAAALAATLGTSVSQNFDSPGTRAKTVALLRQALVGAAAYRDKLGDEEKKPDRDLKMEALQQVLDGELALMITAQTATEIATALRLQREFGFRLWLDGAAEAYRVIEPLRAAGTSVLLHPTMIRSGGEMKNAGFDTAAKLAKAGIPFAIQTGFESYVPKARVLIYEASAAVHAGLDPADALRAITLEPARILGLDDRIGSLEPGKDADLVLYDGDPFEYTTHVCKVIIDGHLVSDECH